MTDAPEMKMNRLAPWFGADLAVAEAAAKLIGKRAWVGIPFAGGCSIVPFIETRSGLAADLHRHIINLARVIRDPELYRPHTSGSGRPTLPACGNKVGGYENKTNIGPQSVYGCWRCMIYVAALGTTFEAECKWREFVRKINERNSPASNGG